MNESSGVLALLIVALLVIATITLIQWRMTKRREAATLRRQMDRNIVCVHCQTRGSVTTRIVHHSKGIDGGKAAVALLTGGVSLLLTGLSRYERQTEARCACCGSVWHF